MDLLWVLLGFSFSIAGGHLVVEQCWHFSKKYLIKDSTSDDEGIPPRVVGLVERVFFTFAAAIDPAITIPAMIGWIGVKLATGWQRVPEKEPSHAVGALRAAGLGLISMAFALAGGLICRIGLPG